MKLSFTQTVLSVSVGIVVIAFLIANSEPADSASSSDYQSPETAALEREGKEITDQMKEANRNHDFSHVEEITRHRTDFMRRSREVLERRASNGDKDAQRLLNQSSSDSAFR